MTISSSHSSRSLSIEQLFIQSWWVIFFILGCYLCLEHGLQKKDHDFAKLQLQHQELLKKKKMFLAQQEDLNRQINSQTDPVWVELVLMKGLGLVPEGQKKVLFTNQQELLESYKTNIR